MNMKKLFVCLAMLMPLGIISENVSSGVELCAKAKEYKTVVFATNLHCENCAKKVIENISYVKGVKDLKVSLEKQEIFIKFDSAKTSVETLQSEIKKLGYLAVEKKN